MVTDLGRICCFTWIPPEICHSDIQTMRQRLPLLGLDSDNGGEFINDILFRYCQNERVIFTRSRLYRKNDQAQIE
jgi:hypothetical protein